MKRERREHKWLNITKHTNKNLYIKEQLKLGNFPLNEDQKVEKWQEPDLSWQVSTSLPNWEKKNKTKNRINILYVWDGYGGANVSMSMLWSKLALSSFLKAENESAGSKVEPAATTAKCVMRWERKQHTHTLGQKLFLLLASIYSSHSHTFQGVWGL